MAHKIEREWHKKVISKYGGTGGGVFQLKGGGWVYFADERRAPGRQHSGVGSTAAEAVVDLRKSRTRWLMWGYEQE